MWLTGVLNKCWGGFEFQINKFEILIFFTIKIQSLSILKAGLQLKQLVLKNALPRRDP